MSVNADDWEQHWTSFAESALGNPAQRYRRRLILDSLALSDGACVLDVGSGTGDLIAALGNAHPGVAVLGVELSEAGVRIAAEKVPSADFLRRDLLTAGEVPGEYRGWASHVVCSEVLEHVEHPEVLLRNVLPFVRSGGRVVITVPGGPMSAFDRAIGHRRHYRIRELEQLLGFAGLRIESVTAAGFPFFNLYRLVVIRRRRKLVDDVSRSEDGAAATGLARAMMSVFDKLFRLTATGPGSATSSLPSARLRDPSIRRALAPAS